MLSATANCRWLGPLLSAGYLPTQPPHQWFTSSFFVSLRISVSTSFSFLSLSAFWPILKHNHRFTSCFLGSYLPGQRQNVLFWGHFAFLNPHSHPYPLKFCTYLELSNSNEIVSSKLRTMCCKMVASSKRYLPLPISDDQDPAPLPRVSPRAFRISYT